MEMEVQPGGLTGCPDEQQKTPSVPGCGWAEERKGLEGEHQDLEYPGNPKQLKPTAPGTARPRGRQRAAVGLKSPEEASAASAVPEGSLWECGEHLSPHPAATRPSRHAEG